MKKPRIKERREKHGAAGTLLYNVWAAIVQRCENPHQARYADYGGRGITMCRRWRESFAAFREDVGTSPGIGFSLDRINNDGNYEPGNVRWADAKMQRRNGDRIILIEVAGETKCLKDWAIFLGVPYMRLYWKIRNGAPFAYAARESFREVLNAAMDLRASGLGRNSA